MLAVNHMFASLRTNPSNHNEVLNEFASAMLWLSICKVKTGIDGGATEEMRCFQHHAD
ncbi:hypothetical protein DCAR_0208025 [Daucus carota subsp. sativus]|uniref:Uncharacterized protein n=1 Tax=Daucus carota subsp. sativus TaxID=79200 RepID=A0A166E9N1_DAUCS|nr:hypothetical protein DCAR_0208025 [Daucus carota subsp. sativus]